MPELHPRDVVARALLAPPVFWGFTAFAFVARPLLQKLRTGDAGVRGVSGRNGPVAAAADLAIVPAWLAVGGFATARGRRGDAPSHAALGAPVALAGAALGVASQRALGTSWRIGVGEGERTRVRRERAVPLGTQPVLHRDAVGRRRRVARGPDARRRARPRRAGPRGRGAGAPRRGAAPAAHVRREARLGPELQVHGSSDLAQTLLSHGLVDELHLLQFPLVLGPGKRLFGSGRVPTALQLVGTRTTSKGVLIGTFRPAGRPAQGSAELEDGATRLR